jgi:hypothetical protein
MYFFVDATDSITKTTMRSIITNVRENSYTSFPMVDDNPNMVQYLAWVAEGNEAEEWQPEQETN